MRDMVLIWLAMMAGAAIALLLLPPHLDPAIRLKEWLEKRRKSR